MKNTHTPHHSIIARVDAFLANANDNPIADVIIEELFDECADVYATTADPSFRIALFALTCCMSAIEANEPFDYE